ncbi:vasopressin V2 receptor-like [Hypanus sabinus]|uniref:vasopressin V2 receptor-like n=1 Tax=Hypanus sabinus TaxID=79690 RepID=UPI0028C3F192|nr:vasopressin V2 receptor-like [Hypanus sabinus]
MSRPAILQVKDVCYPVLAVFGLPANLLTIIILSRGKCGLSKCISAYMTMMAVSDLSVILINVLVYEILIFRLSSSFLHYTEVLKATIYVLAVTLELSRWYTVAFTCDRYVAICCQKFKTKYCRVKTARILAAVILAGLCLENIPLLFAFQPQRIIGNISWGVRPKLDIFNSPMFVALSRFKTFQNLLCAFGLILLCNGMTARHILVTSKSRRSFRTHKSKIERDPEMENRKKGIILLFCISGSFILFWLPSAVTNFIASLTMYFDRDYYSARYIAAQTGTLLTNMSSCTNTCIYAATQTNFRAELKTLILSPWTLIRKLIKRNVRSPKAFSHE